MSASSGALVPRNLPIPADSADAVLEFQSATAGIIVTPVSPIANSIGMLVSAMVLACMAVIAFMPINRVVTAPGRVIALSPTIVIQPLEISVVRSINVHEGQQVHEGDLLARLDPTFTQSDTTMYEAQARSYGAEVDRARAELAGTPYDPVGTDADSVQQRALYLQRKAALDSQMSEYQSKIASLQQTVQRITSDVSGYQSRLGIASDITTMRKQLESMQVGSRLNTLTAEDNRSEIARQLASAQAQLQSARADLLAAINERDYQLQDWRSKTSQVLTEAQRKLSDAREALVKAQRRRDLVEMRADRDATVQWVSKVSVGSVVQGAEQLMVLVPADTQFAVEAKIPGDEIGFVAPGQKVVIKLDTLWTQIYGFAEGTVLQISPDSFLTADSGTTPSAQRALTGLSSSIAGNPPSDNPALNNQGYYRARISIGESKFRNLPPEFHLMPGMSLVADVEVGKRTLLTYLLGRAAPLFTEGFREP